MVPSKICKKCGVMQYILEFREKNGSYGHVCADCDRKRNRQYCIKNKEKIKKTRDKYRENNKEKIKNKKTEYNIKNKEKLKEDGKKYRLKNKQKIKNNYDPKYHQEYYQKNKKIISERGKNYYKNNKNKTNECGKIYYKNNKEKIKIQVKKYRKNNKEEIDKYILNYKKEKRKKDVIFKIKELISSAVRKGLKNNNSTKNGKSCFDFLPYSKEELKLHIENLFESWMNWDNWGSYVVESWDDNDSSTWKWNIDHIIPHCTFEYDSMDHPDFKKCWNLSNLRPYSAKLNIVENARNMKKKKN